MARIEVRYPDGESMVVEIPPDRPLAVGYGEHCGLRLAGPGIETENFSIGWEEDALRLRSAPEAPDAVLNELPTRKARLKPNDQIVVGDIELFVRMAAEEYAPTAGITDDRRQSEYYTPMWRSRLFLSIVGGLAALIVLGYGLWIYAQHARARTLYTNAVRAIEDGEYASARLNLDRLLEEFPKDANGDSARVLLGLAKLSQLAEGPSSELATVPAEATDYLTRCRAIPEFADRKNAVADALLRSAERLAQVAKEETNPERIRDSEEILLQVERLTSGDGPRAEAVVGVRRGLAEAQFAIERDQAIAASLGKIDGAIADSDPVAGYRECRSLWTQHRDLRSDPRVANRLTKLRELERTLVTQTTTTQETAWQGSMPELGWSFARHEDAPASGTMAPFLVGDCWYGVDSGSGAVAWRFPVGMSEVDAGWNLGEDRLLVTMGRGDRLVALQRGDGEIAWKTALPGCRVRFPASPLEVAGQIHLAAVADGVPGSGELLTLRAASGRVESRFRFPQRLAGPLAYDPGRKTVLAIGEAESVYTLDVATGVCQRVDAIGHEPGAIETRPIVVDRLVVLAENLANDRARIRAFRIDPEQGVWSDKQSIEIRGRVVRDPVVLGGRLFYATDRNGFAVLDLGNASDDKPLTVAAESSEANERDSGAEEDRPFLVPISESQFFLVGRRLMRYTIQRGERSPSADFQAPLSGMVTQVPTHIGDRFVVACRAGRAEGDAPPGMLRIQSWTIAEPTPVRLGDLGLAPLAVASGKSGSRVVLPGESIPVPQGSLAGVHRVVHSPAGTSPRENVEDAGWRWADEDEDAILFVRPEGAERTAIEVVRDAGPWPPAWAAVFGWTGTARLWEDRVIAVGADHRLHAYRIEDGKEAMDPFPAPFVQGQPASFRAILPWSKEQVFALAGQEMLRLDWRSDPSPLLEATLREELAGFSDQGMSELGVEAYLARGGSAVGLLRERELRALDPSDLGTRGQVTLDAPAMFAPTVEGDRWIIVTEARQIVYVEWVEGKPTVRWARTAPGPILASPLLDEDRIHVGLATGEIHTLADEGAPAITRNTGRQLVAGPWRDGDRLLAQAEDGSLVAVPLDGSAKTASRPSSSQSLTVSDRETGR